MVRELEPVFTEPVTPKDGTVGTERPRALLEAIEEDPAPLVELANRPIISARQFDRATTLQICRLAAVASPGCREAAYAWWPCGQAE